ncbi:MAG: hypothetical protein LLF98_12550 [Clostridium sp.]|uniref:hypothetical protein n=1 Tax=Clostridium sp. TaxID=1506 RepID=UPI0025BCE70A|nr:hypothetical protein [Clostridium sp.]MCE5222048.1 hypothetical protein [Clostridium sp.]
MGYDEEYSRAVVTDWDEVSGCMFSEKAWVNPKDVDTSKSYEKGDFLRVWCIHDGDWCEAENGLDCCCIYQDHENE